MSNQLTEFRYKEGDEVYTPGGRGVILQAKNVEGENRYDVRLVKVVDFIEPQFDDVVYSESELIPVGECEGCIPLTEDFDVGQKID